MVDNGNISDAISHISPEMIQNFSKMFSQSQTLEFCDKKFTYYQIIIAKFGILLYYKAY